MTTKELFQSKSNEQLKNWWMSVTSDQKFDQVMLYAKCFLLETNPTQEMLSGAMLFVTAMLNLCESDAVGTDTMAKIAEQARLVPVDHLLRRKTKEKE